MKKKIVSIIVVAVMLAINVCSTFAATAISTNSSLNLNLRSGPGTSYSVVSKIKPSTLIETTGKTKSNWSQVKVGSKTGWITNEYLAIGKTAYTTNMKLSLNIRKSNSTSASIVGKIPAGSKKITVFGGSKKGFYLIKYNNTVGYVSDDYVSFSKPSSSNSSSSSSKSYYDSKVGKVLGNISKYKTKLDGYTGIAGQCVWYVRNRGYELLGNSGLTGIGGNAKTWMSSAKKKGLKTSTTPKTNSIACFSGGSYGHVIYVEFYDASTQTVYFTEANCSKAKNGALQKASLSKFKKHSSGYQGCIYLY